MSDLNILLAAALVGTSRASLPPHADSPLADALNSIKRDDVEATLLARAALAGLATRAGQRPEAAPPLPPAPPAETRPEAPPRVTRHLTHVLNTPMLAEWLTLCAAAGWRAPASALPGLLDWAAGNFSAGTGPEQRALLRPVLGERGSWLADFAEQWRWLSRLGVGAVSVDDGAWDSATEASREHLFRGLRADDAAAARTFLSVRFKTEKAGVRKRLLDVLAQTWQDGDAELEPLLEEALTDRSEDVRTQARRLLQRWPGSAHNARMEGRVRALIKPEKVGLLGRLTGQSKYSLVLPETPDADLKRDGLDPVKHPAERLRQLLGGANPAGLLRALDLTPAELVAVAAQFEGVDELVKATFAAGAKPPEAALSELAELLLPHLKGNMTSWRAALLALAPATRRGAELRTALRTQDSGVVWELLRGTPGPWPRDLSGEVLRQLSRAIRRAESQYAPYSQTSEWNYAWSSVLERAATHAAPDAPRPAPLHPEAPAYARQTLDTLYATLDLRAQMHADFSAQEQP